MSTTERLTVSQAADELGVSDATVRNWIHSGRLEATQVGPKLFRLERSALAAVESRASFTTTEEAS